MKRYEALNSAFGRNWSLGEWAVDSFKKKLRRKGRTIVVDTKGKRTDVYKLKRKLFEKRYPDLTIKEV